MVDYQGNSNQKKQKENLPEKNIEPVVAQGEVVVKKPSIGRKFRDLFVAADFKSVVSYVTYEIIIPAAKNMFVDTVSKGAARMTYGEPRSRQNYGQGTKFSYQTPVNRAPRETSLPYRPNQPAIGMRSSRRSMDAFVLSDQAQADEVLERMADILDTYQQVTVMDLHELLGLPTTPMDNNWGWVDLSTAHVRQIREGYLIELPEAEHIQ